MTRMTTDKINLIDKKCEEVEKLLEKNNIYAEVYPAIGQPVLCIEIHWGDWKHDHIFAKNLATSIPGVYFLDTEETETDGSDCYSAIHYFLIK